MCQSIFKHVDSAFTQLYWLKVSSKFVNFSTSNGRKWGMFFCDHGIPVFLHKSATQSFQYCQVRRWPGGLEVRTPPAPVRDTREIDANPRR